MLTFISGMSITLAGRRGIHILYFPFVGQLNSAGTLIQRGDMPNISVTAKENCIPDEYSHALRNTDGIHNPGTAKEAYN